MFQSQRDSKRLALAESICRLPYSRLLEWGITRVADVSGLDTIGLPVFTSVRPSGKVISISAGKGLTKIDAKTGAILEACELWSAENPCIGETVYLSSSEIDTAYNSLSFSMFPLCRDSVLNNRHPISWDSCHDIIRNREIYVPSDVIWMCPRVKQPFNHFQTSSNGLAAGVTEKDAILQATYEVIERDGWSLSDYIQERLGKWPKRISLECEFPESIAYCLNAIMDSGSVPYVFDLTTDIGIPIFGCHILDLSVNSVGLFAGFGCSLNSETALRRAITEAAQGRCAYISGARDDLFRRKFLLMKNNRNEVLHHLYDSLPISSSFTEHKFCTFNSIEEEWLEVSCRLVKHGITDLYYKTLYTNDDPYFVIVRVIAPTLSPPMWEQWSSNNRSENAVSECLKK